MALINSFNLIDGLASGVGIICSLSFGIWFVMSKHIAYAVFSKSNKIFLGDTGSMIIGFFVTVFVVKFIEFENNTTEILSISSTSAIALYILIVPVFDALRVIIVNILFIIFVLIFNGVKNDILIIIILVMASVFSYIPVFLVNRKTKRNVDISKICVIIYQGVYHSKSMHLLQAGVNLVYTRGILGHVSVQTTEIYAKRICFTLQALLQEQQTLCITRSLGHAAGGNTSTQPILQRNHL